MLDPREVHFAPLGALTRWRKSKQRACMSAICREPNCRAAPLCDGVLNLAAEVGKPRPNHLSHRLCLHRAAREVGRSVVVDEVRGRQLVENSVSSLPK